MVRGEACQRVGDDVGSYDLSRCRDLFDLAVANTHAKDRLLLFADMLGVNIPRVGRPANSPAICRSLGEFRPALPADVEDHQPAVHLIGGSDVFAVGGAVHTVKSLRTRNDAHLVRVYIETSDP